MIRWIEIGLSARRFNVSRSMAHRLWNQFISKDSMCSRPVLSRLRVTTPSGESFLAHSIIEVEPLLSSSLFHIILTHHEQEYSLLVCENAFTILVFTQND